MAMLELVSSVMRFSVGEDGEGVEGQWRSVSKIWASGSAVSEYTRFDKAGIVGVYLGGTHCPFLPLHHRHPYASSYNDADPLDPVRCLELPLW